MNERQSEMREREMGERLVRDVWERDGRERERERERERNGRKRCSRSLIASQNECWYACVINCMQEFVIGS